MDDQGRDAVRPWHMRRKALVAIAKRAWGETGKDNIGLIAAGVAFYGFLALVPLLGAIVLIYGLAADQATVVRDMGKLAAVMPTDVAKLVGEQLLNVVQTSDGKKGLGLLLAFGLALFGARNGAGAIITALNVAYEEEEKRGFLLVNLLSLAMTAVAVLVAILALGAITALGHLENLIPHAPDAVLLLGKIGAYLLLTLAGAAAAAALYRYGPSRQRAQWVWLTPGSVVAALLWLVLTIGFGIYVANFSNYNATYGSLGAVVVTLTWLYLSSYILLFGAELNSEFEHQTAQDTTMAQAPLGQRGAWAADHVAGTDDDGLGPAPSTPIAPNSPAQEPPSIGRQVVTANMMSRAASWAGMPKVHLGSSIAATIGLALVRAGKTGAGLSLIGTTAGLAWLAREREVAQPPNRR